MQLLAGSLQLGSLAARQSKPLRTAYRSMRMRQPPYRFGETVELEQETRNDLENQCAEVFGVANRECPYFFGQSVSHSRKSCGVEHCSDGTSANTVLVPTH